MRSELAILYAKQRMQEMGFAEYEMHLRQIRLTENQTLTVEGGSDLWILCDEQYIDVPLDPEFSKGLGLRIESENGVFDLQDVALDEAEHEHTGKITITNQAKGLQYVMFLQLTPKI